MLLEVTKMLPWITAFGSILTVLAATYKSPYISEPACNVKVSAKA